MTDTDALIERLRDRGWKDKVSTATLLDEAADALAALTRERDEWMTPFIEDGIEWHENLPNPYTYQASDFGALVAAVHQYEARAVAAEAALAQIEKESHDIFSPALERVERMRGIARSALGEAT